MELEILNTSFVVRADSHNPTVLHPYFLATEGIVPRDWSVAEQPLCTPGFSVVKYENGIVFSVDPDKLQVVDNNPPEDPGESIAPKLALEYVRQLPHVRYTAAGANIAAFLPCADAERLLIDRFLKQGPWNDAELTPGAVGLNFVYPTDDAVLLLSCDAGRVARPGRDAADFGVLVSGNFHLELPEDSGLDAIEQLASSFESRADYFIDAVGRIFGTDN